MDLARDIALRYAASDREANDLERDILRHMEHHMKMAVRHERAVCAQLALEKREFGKSSDGRIMAERISNAILAREVK